MAFIFKNFRSYVVGGATDSFFLLPIILESGCEAKISQFDFHVLVEKEVTEFKAK